MRTPEEIREKVEALDRDVNGGSGFPMDMITTFFKKGALTFGQWVLDDEQVVE